MMIPAYLYRYILKAHLGPFLFSVCIITFILVMDIIFQIADLIIGKNLDLLIVLEVFVLNLAWIVAVSIPMSVLVATLMAFGRLSADNEISALKAGGVSFMKMISPVIVAGVFLGIGHLYFMDVILPEANHKARSLMNDIHRARPTLLVSEGIFMKEIPGYGIRSDRINPRNNEIYGITIYETKDRRHPVLLRAKSGELHVNETGSQVTLMLHEGEQLQHDHSSDQFIREVFERQRLTILNRPTGIQRTSENTRSDRELNIVMMRQRADTFQKEIDAFIAQLNELEAIDAGDSDSLALQLAEESPQTVSQLAESQQVTAQLVKTQRAELLRVISMRQQDKNRYLVEIHKKYAIAAACLVFVLIGAPLGLRIRRGSIGISVGVSLGFFLLYWACLLGGEELADRSLVDPVWAMWAANVIIGVPGALLVWVTTSER